MQVYVTLKAEKQFWAIVEFIQIKWGEKTAKQFIQKTDEIFTLLKNHPLIGKVEKEDINGFQLTHQTQVLYRIRGNRIIILAFFDVIPF